MNRTRISKAYRGSQHVGWRKTVAGRDWFLGYGTTPSDEARARAVAEVLEAKWKLGRLAGATQLSETDLEDAKDLVAGRPTRPPIRSLSERRNPTDALVPPTYAIEVPLPPTAIAPSTGEAEPARASLPVPPPRWLHASIDEFVATTRRSLKPDRSNGDYVFNLIDNIKRARGAVGDVPLVAIRRKELDEWLIAVRALPSKFTGKPLGAVTVRNLVAAVRVAMTKFAEWEWWTPPGLWEKAFKGYSIKKLQTPAERKKRRKRPPIHSLDEKRVLWNLALPATKAYMALADWAGHTQKEIATLTFDEIDEVDGEMFIDRDRHKTGVHGRWWIPPEAAVYIRHQIGKTPRDPAVNPLGLAFLTPRNMPVVHRAADGKHARSDYVGSNLWGALMRHARLDFVKHISFKGMRKATAQQIRDKWGKEVSRTFLAHADEDVQDENYTRACELKVEVALRHLHTEVKGMFEKIKPTEWDEVRRRIRVANGLPPEDIELAVDFEPATSFQL
jgi:hypothetical protein